MVWKWKGQESQNGQHQRKKRVSGSRYNSWIKKKEITKLGLETGAFLPTCIILTPAEKTNRRKEVTSRCFEKGSYIVEIYVDATVMGE